MTIGTVTAYREYRLRVERQEFPFLSGTVKAALLLNTYVPDVANHKLWGDVSAHEVAGGGDYAQLTLAGKTIALDGSGRSAVDFDNLDFGAAVTISAKYLVTYLDAATKYLMTYVDLNVGGGNLVVAGGPLVIAVNAAGWYRSTP